MDNNTLGDEEEVESDPATIGVTTECMTDTNIEPNQNTNCDDNTSTIEVSFFRFNINWKQLVLFK